MHICNALALDQLLRLRDGNLVDVDTLRHAEQCDVCSQEIARLRRLQTSLRELPSFVAPPYDGEAIRGRLRAARTFRAASIAAVAGVGALTVFMIAAVYGTRGEVENVAVSDSSQTTALITATTDAEPTVTSLVIRSQELESRLQQLPRRPRIQRVSTSATIDTLQDRIQWVDYQLSLSGDVGMTDRQSARLWQDRVELMDSLVKVRYAEAQHTALLLSGSSRSPL